MRFAFRPLTVSKNYLAEGAHRAVWCRWLHKARSFNATLSLCPSACCVPKVAGSLSRSRRKSEICARESGPQAPPNGQGGRWTQDYATYKKSRHTGASIESSTPVGVSAPVTSSRAKTTMLSEFWLATRR